MTTTVFPVFLQRDLAISLVGGTGSMFPFLEFGQIFYYLFIYLYLFLTVLGLRFYARAFSRCSERGPLFIAVRGPLTVAASLVSEHKLQMCRLSSCGSRA